MNNVGHWVCLFVGWVNYVFIGFVCWLGELCFALGLSVGWINYVGHWFCLFVGSVNYVW